VQAIKKGGADGLANFHLMDVQGRTINDIIAEIPLLPQKSHPTPGKNFLPLAPASKPLVFFYNLG